MEHIFVKAKQLKYTSYKQQNTSNEKYSFRVFLYSIKMKGLTTKLARDYMLKRLEGDPSFKKPKNYYRHKK